jgi:hypothetical protein
MPRDCDAPFVANPPYRVKRIYFAIVRFFRLRHGADWCNRVGQQGRTSMIEDMRDRRAASDRRIQKERERVLWEWLDAILSGLAVALIAVVAVVVVGVW